MWPAVAMLSRLHGRDPLGSEMVKHAAVTYLNVVLLFMHQAIGITCAECGAMSDADNASNGCN